MNLPQSKSDRKNNADFSTIENETLIRGYFQRLNILEGSLGPGRNKLRAEAWRQITESVNLSGGTCVRIDKAVRNRYAKMLCEYRKYRSDISKNVLTQEKPYFAIFDEYLGDSDLQALGGASFESEGMNGSTSTVGWKEHSATENVGLNEPNIGCMTKTEKEESSPASTPELSIDDSIARQNSSRKRRLSYADERGQEPFKRKLDVEDMEDENEFDHESVDRSQRQLRIMELQECLLTRKLVLMEQKERVLAKLERFLDYHSAKAELQFKDHE